MERKKLEDFIPVNPRKAAFFKSLLSFYREMDTVEAYMGYNEYQKDVIDSLTAFEHGDYFLKPYDMSEITILNKDVIKSMLPTMNVKKAIYSALVTFFEETLLDKMEKEEEDGYKTEKENNFISIAKKVVPDFVVMSIISPNAKKRYEKEKQDYMEKNKEKTYSVNVHFDVVVSVKVKATNDKEAKRIAEETAVMEDYEVNDITSCITDIEE